MRYVGFIIVLFMIFIITHANEGPVNASGGNSGVISNFNSDRDKSKWWTYKGKISITKDPKNIKEGSGALKWKYKIRKKKWNITALIKLDPSQFKGRKGLSLWLKSDRTGTLLIQIIEKDESNYQYMDFNKPVGTDWTEFKLLFDEFKLDESGSDENNKFDPDQIERIEIYEIAGYFDTLDEGPRTVWIDDISFLDKSGASTSRKTEGPGSATRGVSYEKGKFGFGVFMDREKEKVIFPVCNSLNPVKGTIEMWIQPSFDGTGRKKMLLSCEDRLDIWGGKGNSITFYFEGERAVFQVNELVLSSSKLPVERKKFHHIAAGWNKHGAVLYFDGKKVGENKKIKSLAKISNNMVIGNLEDGSAPAQAVIDELRLSSVKRDSKDIIDSLKRSEKPGWDRDTLFLAHFDGSPLPVIDIKHNNFNKQDKKIFTLSVPTPILGRETKTAHVLRYEVLEGNVSVLKGSKTLDLAVGDLSGQKNKVRIDIGRLQAGGRYKLKLELFYNNDLLNRGEEAFLVFPADDKSRQAEHPHSEEKVKKWFNKVQVYGIIPLSRQEAKKYNITVNGVWGGIHTADPILPFKEYSPAVRKKYKTASEYVSEMHDAGLKTSGAMLAFSGGNQSVIERWPELKNAASRTALGRTAMPFGENSYAMSASSPEWNEWMIAHAKRAIDAGADLIMIDDIQEFLFPFQLGFDHFSIDGFKEYLRTRFTRTELSAWFGINDVDDLNVIQRISDKANLSYEKRIERDPLVEVFARFLEENNYQTKKQIVKELKSYAGKKGREIAVTGNIYALGTTRINGYWPKGLYLGEIVDFFTFENIYAVAGEKLLETPFPRGKWMAWDKLGFAATGSPAVALVAAESLEKIASRNISNYLYIHFAEAYANQSAYMLYHIPAYKLGKLWKQCAKAAGFVLDNRDIYETDQSVYSKAAVLYLYGEGMRTKTYNYLGLAQALAESNIPFELIFSGDGYYLKDDLTVKVLEKYKAIIIPSVTNITDNQKKIIKEYVSLGGSAIIFDPLEFNINRSQVEVAFHKGRFVILPPLSADGEIVDAGTAYFRTYNDKIRKYIEKTVKKYVDSTITIDNTERKLIAYPYYQPGPKRLVIHLVNYDHNFKNDRVRIKRNVNIRIKKPDFYTGQKQAYMISPDFSGKKILPITSRGDYLEINIPELYVYNIVIL